VQAKAVQDIWHIPFIGERDIILSCFLPVGIPKPVKHGRLEPIGEKREIAEGGSDSRHFPINRADPRYRGSGIGPRADPTPDPHQDVLGPVMAVYQGVGLVDHYLYKPAVVF
jgi:hypothetical protein